MTYPLLIRLMTHPFLFLLTIICCATVGDLFKGKGPLTNVHTSNVHLNRSGSSSSSVGKVGGYTPNPAWEEDGTSI